MRSCGNCIPILPWRSRRPRRRVICDAPEELLLEKKRAEAQFLRWLSKCEDALAAYVPVLLAIDDYQWSDAPSRAVVTFAARRIKGRVGVLVTERAEPGCRSR